MSHLWPGPGRALQAHLELFSRVDRATRFYDSHIDDHLSVHALPGTLQQRLKLMTTMGDIGPQIVTADGVSIANQRDDDSIVGSQVNVMRTIGLLQQEHGALNKGETHYISHHITAAIETAAELAEDEPLFPTDLPCPAGLMVFEYPLILSDLHPGTGQVMPNLQMPVRAIVWSRQDVWARKEDGTGDMENLPGLFYALYTDGDAFRDIYVTSVERELPTEYADFKPLYEGTEGRDPMWCIDTSGWSFGRSWRRAGPHVEPRDALPQGLITDSVATVRRFLLALWRFQWQRILVPQIHRPSRHEHRQALRAGMRLEDGYVKVLRLRRHVEAEARGETISGDQLAYDHQWMVRGHPRRQWFPSLGPARNEDGTFNVDSHRLIWIEPFVKGNPYAPLVVGHNVTAVVR